MHFSNVQEKMRAFGESGSLMGNFKIVMFLAEVPTSSRDGMDFFFFFKRISIQIYRQRQSLDIKLHLQRLHLPHNAAVWCSPKL